MMAQAGRLYDLDPGEAAYYAAQPIWFVVLTDISLLAAIAGALALLWRKSMAVSLFALSLGAIFITNGYEFAVAADGATRYGNRSRSGRRSESPGPGSRRGLSTSRST